MIQAQVALLASAKSRFEERALELPAPQVGEAIVEIDLCTVCGSDLHSFNGRRPMSGVTVLGHEIVGRVVALPDGELHDFLGQRISEGDRISWSLCASCRECFWCKNDLPQKCQHLFKYGHAPWDKSSLATGGLGTHCQLRKGTTIIRVPDGLSDRVICPANCATATAAAE